VRCQDVHSVVELWHLLPDLQAIAVRFIGSAYLRLTVQWLVVVSPAGSLIPLWWESIGLIVEFVQAFVLSAAAVVVLWCTGTPAVLGHSCDAVAGRTGLVVGSIALICCC
jgi:hypothetical protein